MQAGNCDRPDLYRAAMLRRLLAALALITGLAAAATPAEAAWKRGEQASAVSAAVAVATSADQLFAEDHAEDGLPVVAMAVADPNVARRGFDVLPAVELKVDRALE